MATLRFSSMALATFDLEIQRFPNLEVGGVLLGCIVDEDTIFIQTASEGGPKAIHEEFYFQADHNYVDMLIDMEYANSEGKVVYLGEWHTHPQIHPEPSPKDLHSLTEIAASAEQFSILLIIGATNYQTKKFIDHSIAILKYNDEKMFYTLERELD